MLRRPMATQECHLNSHSIRLALSSVTNSAACFLVYRVMRRGEMLLRVDGMRLSKTGFAKLDSDSIHPFSSHVRVTDGRDTIAERL